MSIVVNTNVSSLGVQRSLTSATNGLQTAYERLSTGSKINKASDDAAGLTISEGLKSQINGASVASNNAQSGINLLQTAEGDLGVIQDNLQRIRDLTVQASNGTYSSTEKDAIKKEVNARLSEIDRIAKGSSFNKIKLLDGSNNSSLKIQIGTNAEGSVNSLDIGSALGSALCSNLSSSGATNKLTSANVSTFFDTASKTASFLTVVDDAISNVSARRSDIGAYQNRLNSATQSLAVKSENLSSSRSRITDTDVAKESANMTKSQILQQISTSLMSQANQAPSVALSLV